MDGVADKNMKTTFFQYKKMYNRIENRLKETSAMTLTEMLAALLILSMTAVAIAGGVTAVKNAYQKVTQKAEAQQILSATAELMTDELSSALEDEDGGTDGWDFLSGKNGIWMHFESNHEQGICKVYGDEEPGTSNGDLGQNTVEENTADNADQGSKNGVSVPLLSQAAMGNLFYTDYDSYIYEDGCFKVKDLAVYYRNEETNSAERVPAAILNELVVRAVNLGDTQS